MYLTEILIRVAKVLLNCLSIVTVFSHVYLTQYSSKYLSTDFTMLNIRERYA